MKRFIKTALALLLVLALSAPAYAAELYPGEKDIYMQLSPAGQEVYDRLNTRESLACIRSGEPIEIAFSGNYGTEEELRQIIKQHMSAASEAFSAMLLTHPEIFWVQSCEYGGYYTYDGSSYDYPLHITPHFKEPWSSGARSVAEDEATLRAAVQALAAEAAVQGGPYQQLEYVHDWLTQHNVYNSEAAASDAESSGDCLPWTPLSALTDESQPVCEGYARAFSMLCDELGYPCLLVSGIGVSSDGAQGPHAWNMVQVANKWYAVDATFDDPTVKGVTTAVSGYESHDYFMVGEYTLIDDYHIFSDTHYPTGNVSGNRSFTYPALTDEALDPAFTWAPPDIDPDEPEYAGFSDVEESAYYADAVAWAVAAGVTNGKVWDEENGIFEFWPEAQVTRAEAVTFLWRAMGEPEPETQTNRFSDVPAGSFYEKAVLWAVENGITNGTAWDEEHGVYEFSPAAPVTRGQLLTFLWRTVGRPGDTGNSVWYADAEAWAAACGILGDTQPDYTTGGACPRCDVVYYLCRAVSGLAG